MNLLIIFSFRMFLILILFFSKGCRQHESFYQVSSLKNNFGKPLEQLCNVNEKIAVTLLYDIRHSMYNKYLFKSNSLRFFLENNEKFMSNEEKKRTANKINWMESSIKKIKSLSYEEKKREVEMASDFMTEKEREVLVKFIMSLTKKDISVIENLSKQYKSTIIYYDVDFPYGIIDRKINGLLGWVEYKMRLLLMEPQTMIMKKRLELSNKKELLAQWPKLDDYNISDEMDLCSHFKSAYNEQEDNKYMRGFIVIEEGEDIIDKEIIVPKRRGKQKNDDIDIINTEINMRKKEYMGDVIKNLAKKYSTFLYDSIRKILRVLHV